MRPAQNTLALPRCSLPWACGPVCREHLRISRSRRGAAPSADGHGPRRHRRECGCPKEAPPRTHPSSPRSLRGNLATARAAPETKTMRPAGPRGQTSYPFRVCIRSIYPRQRMRRRRRDDDENDNMRLVFCLAAPTVRQALSDADPQAQVLSSNAVRCATGRGRQRGYECASPRISR